MAQTQHSAGEAAGTNIASDIGAVLLLAAALALPAIYNGFPLIFPDSGTYLQIAFDSYYSIDRSSFYGFLLKPFAGALPGLSGLWLALAAQILLVAGVMWIAARALLTDRRWAWPVLAATAVLTSAGFHAGQFMPDAFTAATVLLAWLAASRDPAAPGAPLLWLAVVAAALLHYTHMPLAAVAVAATLVARRLLGLSWRDVGRRAVAGLVAVGLAAGIQVGMNTAQLEQRKIAPMGPLFLYARLNEDGLIKPWLERHCGDDAPEALCALAPKLPNDSQVLLWNAEESPIATLVWSPADPAQRWRTVEAMAQANRGAILQSPAKFAASSVAGAADQLVHFAPLDDECPVGCRERSGGIASVLNKYRPETLPALDASAQVSGRMPKPLVRAIVVPLTALAMLLLPLAGWAAWRRRDSVALTLVAAVGTTLIANAALAGALSDVHDRYQSRIAWLAPFLILALAVRWRSAARLGARIEPQADPEGARPRTLENAVA